MHEAVLSHHPKGVLDSLASRVLDFHNGHWQGGIPASQANKFLHAVHARENCVDAPGGVEVWKYEFPMAANRPVEDLHVRFTTGGDWTGIFQCTRGRHVDVLVWPAANAVVVAAANAVYLVDPSIPEQFSGFAAPVEITDVTFDEAGERMFVADSLRVYAFSPDRILQWMSEPLEGYGARFCGCGGRVLAVEIKPFESGPEDEEAAPSVIRLRAEDGTILRSRFRLVHQYWKKRGAA